MKKTIAIGASVSFYNHVADIRRQLIHLDFDVFVPDAVLEMEAASDFDEKHQRVRYEQLSEDEKKRMVSHLFAKIAASDGFLIVNNTKHEMEGYIGPNVLMEMAVALYLQKPIFLLNEPSVRLAGFSEIMAIQPIVLRGNLKRISDYFKEGDL